MSETTVEAQARERYHALAMSDADPSDESLALAWKITGNSSGPHLPLMIALALDSALATAREAGARQGFAEAAEIAEAYLHTEGAPPHDEVDRIAAYSNSTVRRIVKRLRQCERAQTEGRSRP